MNNNKAQPPAQAAPASATPKLPHRTGYVDIDGDFVPGRYSAKEAEAYADARVAHTLAASTQPAPANYSLDADVDGIRKRAADAITGALALGFQNGTRPPPGHWLTPFWDLGRAEATRPAPAQQASDEDADPTSKAQYRRMFGAACEALGEVNEALGLDPDDGGAEPILHAIDELRKQIAAPTAEPVARLHAHGIVHLLPPMTFSANELRRALDFASQDTSAPLIDIQYKKTGKNVDGEDAPAGWYCWAHGHKEEGALWLDPASTPPLTQPSATPVAVDADMVHAEPKCEHCFGFGSLYDSDEHEWPCPRCATIDRARAGGAEA